MNRSFASVDEVRAPSFRKERERINFEKQLQCSIPAENAKMLKALLQIALSAVTS